MFFIFLIFLLSIVLNGSCLVIMYLSLLKQYLIYLHYSGVFVFICNILYSNKLNYKINFIQNRQQLY